MERLKLHNTKSLKSFPEEYQKVHRISYRHKNSSFESPPPPPPPPLPSNQYRRNSNKRDFNQKKSPVYVHNINNEKPPLLPPLPLQKGDFTTKEKPTNNKKLSSVIDKLEEAYWANWKPNKPITPIVLPQKVKSLKKEITIIKEPVKSKIKNDTKLIKNSVESRKSQEVQTEILNEPKVVSIEKIQEQIIEEKPEKNEQQRVDLIEKQSNDAESKLLKHTDSVILYAKNQNKEKEHVEQPKYIKLSKKTTTTKTFMKGGSYPLKSTLKSTVSTTNRGSVHLGRPGSPLIISNKQYRK